MWGLGSGLSGLEWPGWSRRLVLMMEMNTGSRVRKRTLRLWALIMGRYSGLFHGPLSGIRYVVGIPRALSYSL